MIKMQLLFKLPVQISNAGLGDVVFIKSIQRLKQNHSPEPYTICAFPLKQAHEIRSILL